jgi:hypothetical protein
MELNCATKGAVIFAALCKALNDDSKAIEPVLAHKKKVVGGQKYWKARTKYRADASEPSLRREDSWRYSVPLSHRRGQETLSHAWWGQRI